jgi:pimeloyl-ACP methyl ester carboxylesterase
MPKAASRPERPEPFVLQTNPATLDDLRARLRATRWPDAPDGVGWSVGTDLDYLRELVGYWVDGFDWAAQEKAIGRLPHFRVRLGDFNHNHGPQRVHFVHVRAAKDAEDAKDGSAKDSRLKTALPLILCHGWPDSFWRYLKVIPLLTDPGAHGGDPADAFDVIVPDMPGFGYSDRPRGRVLSSMETADLWAELMEILGYDRFGAAGGDMGSHVSRFLALNHSGRLVAVHRMDAGLPVFAGDPQSLTAEERRWMKDAAEWGASEGAYAAMHRTKPQTAAFGLNDSPAGLAAWIVEKLRAWSDCGGDIECSYAKDEILTNIMIYWLTETIGSSIRMYRANAAIPAGQHARRVEVPSGFSLFRGDILKPPRSWLNRVANVVRITEPPRGGHFAPFEQPELYARELRDFFRPYRMRQGVRAEVAPVPVK